MSFLQPEFIGFVVALVLVYWAVPSRRAQNGLLLVASYVFYGWMSPRLCLLLASVTGANYLAGLVMERFPARRGPVLGAVVVASVLNLVWFKYFGWFASELIPRFTSPEQASAIAAWKLALPLGLSFYTFHNLAYSIDVYRVLELFNVTNPSIAHATKKLLVAGGRGAGKSIDKDIQEAIDSLVRWQAMRNEDRSKDDGK